MLQTARSRTHLMVLKSCRLADFYRKGGFVPRQVIGRDRRIPGHAIVQPDDRLRGSGGREGARAVARPVAVRNLGKIIRRGSAEGKR